MTANFVEQAAKIKQLRALARLMDEAITIPGTNVRLGVDSIVGLIPVAGDLLSATLSLYIIREAARLGVPKKILLRMTFNLGVDVLVGAVPVAGDVFDVLWKANKKNLDLLEKYLKKKIPEMEGVIDV